MNKKRISVTFPPTRTTTIVAAVCNTSVARRRSPTAAPVGCTQQCQNSHFTFTYPVYRRICTWYTTAGTYVFVVYIHRSAPSLARRRSPAAELVGCTQQYQNVTPVVRYQVLVPASVTDDDAYGVTHNLQ